MMEAQTIRLDISSDDVFLPYVRQFVSDTALAMGFTPRGAGLAEAETNALFSYAVNVVPGGMLRLECRFESPLLRISLFDDTGNLYGTREVVEP
jgi:hypothetical protein